ncbi:hypothetical protein [Sporichthya sp.]|uniref:hypothetical protein n=1 Tax=Sporichthya sp. TaxID=65475 RepID=UPI00181AA97A|nr:hypothetical protein [Sporichthya sp.]MBA3743434.1 hypothetical protein [Sporichthya sp.]
MIEVDASTDRTSQLEAELQALRVNSALAHEQLHATMAAELAALSTAHERLHLAYVELQTNHELELRRRKRQREEIEALRAELTVVRRQRDAAVARLKRNPLRQPMAAARMVAKRARAGGSRP